MASTPVKLLPYLVYQCGVLTYLAHVPGDSFPAVGLGTWQGEQDTQRF